MPGVDIDVMLGEPMVQDGNPEQDVGVEEHKLPQTDPEPGMGAAAAEAAEYDTPPPFLRQTPSPAPSETAHNNGGSMQLNWFEIKQLTEAINGMINGLRTQRGEMRQMGQCLQAGKMATPRAATNELGGSATALRPAVAAGEDRVIRRCVGRDA